MKNPATRIFVPRIGLSLMDLIMPDRVRLKFGKRVCSEEPVDCQHARPLSGSKEGNPTCRACTCGTNADGCGDIACSNC